MAELSMRRCSFAVGGMVCVLEEQHESEPIFGGHHLVATRYVDSEEPWDEARRAAFLALYEDEEDGDG